MEVGISDVGEELIQSVAGLVRKCEYSLEQKVEVGVVADQTSVESLVGECPDGHDVGVVVVQCAEFVDQKRVELDVNSSLPERRGESSPHGQASDLVDPGNISQFEPVSLDAA